MIQVVSVTGALCRLFHANLATGYLDVKTSQIGRKVRAFGIHLNWLAIDREERRARSRHRIVAPLCELR